MIVAFLRSSSLGTYDICQHKWFLNYSLGLKEPTGRAAAVGIFVHAIFEVLARYKKAIQDNSIFFENDTLGRVDVASFSTKSIVPLIRDAQNASLDYQLSNEDYREGIRVADRGLKYLSGAFDPRNMNIFEIEYFFDITLDHDWAKYSYEINGKEIKGQLSLKGTIDLIVDAGDSTLEVFDWKTGKLVKWSSGKTKTVEDLAEDKQILLYILAIAKSFPNYDNIIFTIFYLKEDFAHTIAINKKDIPSIEEKIKSWYLTIKNNNDPQPVLNWKCNFCNHNKTFIDNDTTCNYYIKKVQELGIDKTLDLYGDTEKIFRYGAGGSSRDRK